MYIYNMNFIVTSPDEEYKFTLNQDDRTKLKKEIDKLLDDGKDISSDIARIAITLYAEGDKAYTNENMHYSHYTFNAITSLLKK